MQYWNWKKKTFTVKRLLFLRDVDIEKVIISKTAFFSERNYNNLLVTCINQARGYFLVY